MRYNQRTLLVASLAAFLGGLSGVFFTTAIYTPAAVRTAKEDRDRCLVLAARQNQEIEELRESSEEQRRVLKANKLL